MWGRRIAVTTLAGAALVVAGSWPALATFTVNTAGCSGSATIAGTDGKTYKVNAAKASADVPREGTVTWQGGTSKVVKNHSGSISIKIGPASIPIDSWASPNKKGSTSASGTREMPSALKWVPPGEYLVTGGHAGKGGRCSGSIVLNVQGSAFSTPGGIVALAGTVVFAALTLLAGLAKKAGLS